MRLICALVFFFCAASKAVDMPAWRLVWSDEFNQPTGSAPATTNWSYEIGGNNGWGNNELEYYTNRRTNSWTEGGALYIQALKETFGGSNYTSARIKTQGKQSWQYGRVEARMKLPYGQGIWPAFWMLGANITSVGWPACGEIDIMEHKGHESTIVRVSVHGPDYSGANFIGGQGGLIVPQALSAAFHTYAIEWETNRIRWFLDNVQIFTITPNSLRGNDWVFDKPQFIIFNLAVGGNFVGPPDASTVFPQKLIIDYVRVYTRTSAPQASLDINNVGDHVELSWPWDYPHVRLQRINLVGQTSWSEIPLTGVRLNGDFLQTVTPGYYRLRWQ